MDSMKEYSRLYKHTPGDIVTVEVNPYWLVVCISCRVKISCSKGSVTPRHQALQQSLGTINVHQEYTRIVVDVLSVR